MPAVTVEPMKNRDRQDLLDELAREKACLVDLDAQRDRARQRITDLQAEISAASGPVATKPPVAPLPVVQKTAASERWTTTFPEVTDGSKATTSEMQGHERSGSKSAFE